MKKLFFILILSSLVWGEEPPAYLKDGTITVTLKNGKQYEFSTNEWKVVPRRGDEVAPEADEEDEDEPTYVEQSVRPAGPNRVRLMAGVGPTGLKDSRSPGKIHVETDFGAVGGVGLDRSLTDRISINGSAYTNGTFSLGVGLDF
jgi:hypothetical protein